MWRYEPRLRALVFADGGHGPIKRTKFCTFLRTPASSICHARISVVFSPFPYLAHFHFYARWNTIVTHKENLSSSGFEICLISNDILGRCSVLIWRTSSFVLRMYMLQAYDTLSSRSTTIRDSPPRALARDIEGPWHAQTSSKCAPTTTEDCHCSSVCSGS